MYPHSLVILIFSVMFILLNRLCLTRRCHLPSLAMRTVTFASGITTVAAWCSLWWLTWTLSPHWQLTLMASTSSLAVSSYFCPKLSASLLTTVLKSFLFVAAATHVLSFLHTFFSFFSFCYFFKNVLYC